MVAASSAQGGAGQPPPPPALPQRQSFAASAAAADSRDAPLALSIFSAVFFGATSIALVFVNKWGITLFPLTNAILLLQLVMTLALFAAKRATEPSSAFPVWDGATARNAAPLAAVYLGNIVFSLMSLKGLNLPMFLVLRRNTPLACMLFKRLVFGGAWPSGRVAASVIVVCAGSIVAGYANLDADPKPYAMAIGSCFLQATYMLLVEIKTRPPASAAAVAAAAAAAAQTAAAVHAASAAQQGGEGGTPPPLPAVAAALGMYDRPNTHPLTEGEMLHYNALLSLPFIFLIALLAGELGRVPEAAAAAVAQTSAWTLALALGGCAGGGLLLNYATMLCTSTNSALTTTVVGVLKGVVGTLGGLLTLGGGARFTTAGLVGVAMNTAGGVAYSWAKFEEKRAKRAALAAAALHQQALKASGGGGHGGKDGGGWVDEGGLGGAGSGGANGAGAAGPHARARAPRASGENTPLLG